jgi:hypothetical protein
MFVAPPYGFRDTRRLLTALWEAAPDRRDRKSVQQHIADLHVRLLFARQGFELDRSWFTCKQVRQMGVYITPAVDSASPGEERGDRLSLLMSLRPSVN